MVVIEFDTGDYEVKNVNKVVGMNKLIIQEGPIIWTKRVITISGHKNDVKSYIQGLQDSYVLENGEPDFSQNTPWIRCTLTLIKK